MTAYITIYPGLARILWLAILMLCMATTGANDTLDDSDCPIIMPNFDDMVLLTREERIQLMDQALKDALSQVQECRQRISEQHTQSGSSANTAGGSGAASSSNGDGNNNDAANENSNANNSENQQNKNQQQTATPSTATPSSDISGSEAAKQDEINSQPPGQTATPSATLSGNQPVQPKSTTAAEQSVDGQPPLTSSTIRDSQKALDNGQLPEDIPSVDNDDIIAQQIREAALAETDPDKQAKLWNEYRRYKGIPEK
ncbi:MAG: hypothetical protein GDA45_04170 [Chromatiales bacterium]|nr:hypothetical protein [Chromatiales bacterium]